MEGRRCNLGICQSCGENCFARETISDDSCLPVIFWQAGVRHPGYIKCLAEG